MAEYTLAIVDERPVINVIEERTTVTLSASGPQGAQGPVGDQKVFVQSTDPAVENAWGIEDAGKVWIEV